MTTTATSTEQQHRCWKCDAHEPYLSYQPTADGLAEIVAGTCPVCHGAGWLPRETWWRSRNAARRDAWRSIEERRAARRRAAGMSEAARAWRRDDEAATAREDAYRDEAGVA